MRRHAVLHRRDAWAGWSAWSGSNTTDFSSFYAAGALADAGRPAAAYDRGEHYAAEQRATAPGVDYNYFYYPPVFLLLCAALARLPYLVAFLLFETAGLAALAAAARRIIGAPGRAVLLPILAFPAVFWNFGLGQNAFLSAGLLAFATLQLRARRPLLAGLLFGAVCFKPHLGIMIPFALAGGRQWRAFAAAACAVAGLAALSALVFGLGTWEAFFHAFANAPGTYESGSIRFEVMVSVFGAARLLGLDPGPAYALQAIAAVSMAALVFHVWARQGEFATKCAVLLSATLVATPLVLFYDLMLLGVALAWLVQAGRARGFLPGEKLALLPIMPCVMLARSATGPLHVPLGLLASVLVLALAVRRHVVESGAEAGAARPSGAPALFGGSP